jgi:hypothetical protein
MRLRPRYSLLTLLVLTALVAGGVKLWYGPRHVVERPFRDVEEEYSFTRDWDGNKTIHGLWIRWTYHVEGTLQSVQIKYYRRGLIVMWSHCLIAPMEGFDSFEFPTNALSPVEQEQYRQKYEQVRQTFADQGQTLIGIIWGTGG